MRTSTAIRFEMARAGEADVASYIARAELPSGVRTRKIVLTR